MSRTVAGFQRFRPWYAGLQQLGSAAPVCAITLTGDIAGMAGGTALTISGQRVSYTSAVGGLYLASQSLAAAYPIDWTGQRIYESQLVSASSGTAQYGIAIASSDLSKIRQAVWNGAQWETNGFGDITGEQSDVMAIGVGGTGAVTIYQNGAPVATGDVFDVATDNIIIVAVCNTTVEDSAAWDVVANGADFARAYPSGTLDWCGNAAPAFNPLALDGLLVAFDYSDLTTLFKLSDGTDPVTTDLDPVGRINSVVGSLYADQATATARVLYRTAPSRVTFDASNDAYIIRLGAPQTGTFFTATTEGVVVGTFTGGANYQIPISATYPAAETNQTYKLLYDRVLTAGEVEQVVAWLKENKNAGNDVYTGTWANRFRARTDITSLDGSRWTTSGVTAVSTAWFQCTGLTSFPLISMAGVVQAGNAWGGCSALASFPAINFPAVTNLGGAWGNCTSLTSFPLIAFNTSVAVAFGSAWSGCTSLATFPAGFFDGSPSTAFANAFASTNLSEASIDNILVSINSNGTSSGTFNQSGGTAPSVATGRPAIDALRARGWTVTVTGGY